MFRRTNSPFWLCRLGNVFLSNVITYYSWLCYYISLECLCLWLFPNEITANLLSALFFWAPPSELNCVPVRWHNTKHLSSCYFYYLCYRIVPQNVFICISHSLRIQNIGDVRHLYEVCCQTYDKGYGHGSSIGSLPLPDISGIKIRHVCRPLFYPTKHYKWMKESINKIHLKTHLWWEKRFSH